MTKTTKNESTPPSDLKLVPDASQENNLERRRLPRLSLSSEQFRLSQNGKIFSVTDLSLEGMAIRILDRGDLVLFPVGVLQEGILNLRAEKFQIKARVMRFTNTTVGFKFENLADSSVQALKHFLDPSVLGAELRPLPASESQTTSWYHGPSGTDLLFWRATDGQYRRVTLYVLGSFIQWDRETGLSTGRSQFSAENGETRGIVRFETMLLDPDSTPDRGKLSVAKTLILSSNLPLELQKWCVKQLGDPNGS